MIVHPAGTVVTTTGEVAYISQCYDFIPDKRVAQALIVTARADFTKEAEDVLYRLLLTKAQALKDRGIKSLEKPAENKPNSILEPNNTADPKLFQGVRRGISFYLPTEKERAIFEEVMGVDPVSIGMSSAQSPSISPN